jgi:GT2 family glycosyltransferase
MRTDRQPLKKGLEASKAAPPLRVAVAIPTYNRDEVLVDTLRGVLAQEPRADETLVVDQSERHKPEVQAELDRLQAAGEIRYLRQSPPSLTAARNRALRETDCDVVIFIDDDVKLAPDFVAAHRRNYEADAALVAVAGRVVQAVAQAVEQAVARPDGRRPSRGGQAFDLFRFPLDGDERREGVANFRGCNHSVKVAEVLAWGGYDELFRGVAMREESDLALRIYRRGGKIVFDPAASLFHLAAPSGGCRRRSIYDMSVADSMLLFAFKHLGFLRSAALSEVWLAFRQAVAYKATLKAPYALPVLSALFVCALARSAFRGLVSR